MKKNILFIMGLVFAIVRLQAQQIPAHKINGTVLSATDDAPLAGTSLFLKNSGGRTVTNSSGYFSISQTVLPDTLVVTRIGYKGKEIAISAFSKGPLVIRLEPSSTQLQQITVSTGYQRIPKERATGSFDFIDNKLLNRSVSPDILSRLKGVTSGLLFDRSAGNNLNITIRGRSTIFANTQPLIILDNFEYTGDINNINPNDIESITVLKDAAAASIWGARAGNGVIVITTKKGSFDTPVRVSFNTNITVGGKPDLFKTPVMSAADYVSVEKYLFSHGYYDYDLISPRRPPVTPVVEILNKVKQGLLSSNEASIKIADLKDHDVRNDLLQYFYRKPVNQQYFLSLDGGGAYSRYYVSLGYDQSLHRLVGDRDDRLTANIQNTFSFINNKLEITTSLDFAKTETKNNGKNPALIAGASVLYPYAKLADNNGHALPLAQHRQGYLDTVGGGKLLDWNYRPLDEIRVGNNKTQGMDYHANLGIRYRILPGWGVSAKYQYAKGESNLRELNSLETYATRDQINSYTQITPEGLIYPVPMGGILHIDNDYYTSQQLRFQINFDHSWNIKHHLSAIAGTEIKDISSGSYSNTYYGYDDTHGTSIPVDFVNFYPDFITGSSYKINNGQSFSRLTDRYLSYYLNASYTYDSRYTFSVSGRRDASNLFGVKTNQKWVPLWSAGASWMASKASFYHMNWLPYLRLRATFGYNGNVDKRVTAYLTSKINIFQNLFGETDAYIVNPPNPELRWERVKIINLGADFKMRNNRITGSLEYYKKNGLDLIGNVPLPPSTGISGLISLMGNTANTESHGIDVILKSENIEGVVDWNTTFLFSWTKNKVTAYNVPVTSGSSYVNPFDITPQEGRPIKALYSYKWAGLDSAGNPTGYLDGKISEDYAGMINSTSIDNLVYSGSTAPTCFGGLRNTFRWKQFSFSFNITYKFGYYFRRSSINYTKLFSGGLPGHKDFNKRWRKPGDEKRTNVPAMIYPAGYYRDRFYINSSLLVTSGDHIRLQDVRLDYRFSEKILRSSPFKRIRIYLYANNIGILWRKNKQGIDPDYAASFYDYPIETTFSAGMNVIF